MSIVGGSETYGIEHLFRVFTKQKVKFMRFQQLVEILFRLNVDKHDCEQMLDEFQFVFSLKFFLH